jgi:hypothetical protein
MSVKGEIETLIAACNAVLAKQAELRAMRGERDQLATERAELVAQIDQLKAQRVRSAREAHEAEQRLNAAREAHSAVVGEMAMLKGDMSALARRLRVGADA